MKNDFELLGYHLRQLWQETRFRYYLMLLIAGLLLGMLIAFIAEQPRSRIEPICEEISVWLYDDQVIREMSTTERQEYCQ